MVKLKEDRKKKVLKYLSNVGMAIVSLSLMTSPASAVDPSDAAADAVASEGGKQAFNAALKVARSKPALLVATGITCIACVPIAGAAASPGLFIACGILIAKTFG